MMTVSGRIPIRCAALILVLTSVSAVQRLDSINDLKKINFGQSVPTHSLVLLHWFANTVTIDSDDVIRLNFDPNRRDYGSHHYGNYEGLLDPLPRGYTRYQYYTVGNIYQQTEMPLPSHVVHPRSEYAGRNRARIIIRVREQNAGRRSLQIIDEVYITQHYETSDHQGTDYDPDHTYLVTTDLLRQIRQFSMNGDYWLLTDLRNRFGSGTNDSQLRRIRDTWGHLACLGLLLHIVAQKGIYTYKTQFRLQPVTRKKSSNALGYDCVLFILLILFIAYFIQLGSKQQA